MITRSAPPDWRALQAEVGRILTECGFEVEVEKKFQSARGSVELDVYAEETVRGRKYVIVCECKHWQNRVPQNVIHGFRTVAQEVGANIGYVVSMAGFQSGAFTASELTNIELVTWEEFQGKFEESWFEEFFTKEIDRQLSGVMTYAEPILPKWFDQMSDPDKETYVGLKDKHDLFGMLMQSLGPYTRMLRKEPLPTLPLRARLKPDPILETVPSEILDETAYRELLEMSLSHGEMVLSKFRALREKYAT